VMYSFLVGFFIHREIKINDMSNIIKKASLTTGSVMIIFTFAASFSYFLIINQVPQKVGSMIFSLTEDKYIIILLFCLLVFITGMFLESAPQILIYTPLFLPILTELGVSPIHFGMIIIIGTELGLITPPVGV